MAVWKYQLFKSTGESSPIPAMKAANPAPDELPAQFAAEVGSLSTMIPDPYGLPLLPFDQESISWRFPRFPEILGLSGETTPCLASLLGRNDQGSSKRFPAFRDYHPLRAGQRQLFSFGFVYRLDESCSPMAGVRQKFPAFLFLFPLGMLFYVISLPLTIHERWAGFIHVIIIMFVLATIAEANIHSPMTDAARRSPGQLAQMTTAYRGYLLDAVNRGAMTRENMTVYLDNIKDISSTNPPRR
jgi:hypothetical protein